MAGSSHTGSLPAAESGAARSAAKPAGADRSDGKRADTFQADEAKIARNMAAWDKLMALPKQQYPSFKALRKRQKAEPYANVEATIDHKKTDREFPKYAVPLGQLMSVSDKNIKAIEVYYA